MSDDADMMSGSENRFAIMRRDFASLSPGSRASRNARIVCRRRDLCCRMVSSIYLGNRDSWFGVSGDEILVSPYPIPYAPIPYKYVSHFLCFSIFPWAAAKKLVCSFCVIGPGFPSPMVRSSTSLTGVTSAAVPVKKHSSAI